MIEMSRRMTIVGVIGAVAVLVAVSVVVVRAVTELHKNTVVAYFPSSNGIYVGDDVRILGVAVGKVDRIEAEPTRSKITFSYDSAQKVPADAKAAIISPSLVSARAIQLVPAYTAGPVLADGAVIPENRTAVPVEWDDFRAQLQKLTGALSPPPGQQDSSLGQFMSSVAGNLRGNGADINTTLTQLSNAMSILGDKSTDIFSTVRNLQVFVSALSGSSDLMARLNTDLADVTQLLDKQPNSIGTATQDLQTALTDIESFVRDNRDNVSISAQHLGSITQALHDSEGDVKQLLHIAPTAFQNFVNIYHPAQGSLTGVLAFNNFSNPIEFICGAIQAASKKNAEDAAKLCAQYLGPVLKNLEINFPPVGANPITGAAARPNEIDYSEDRLRPSTPQGIEGLLNPGGGR
ncbi:mammalian cell entry protein [Nocardia nova]|uniref:Mammalian cell entry protein n=2 Tax=Nocardia nova TaxID=37330 RepID=A0A2S6AMU4_9NOCA|nr:mammalian cell entry protein [Nocardia nova]PPJ36567.1 mammalian cell entry protein [Nocardia nova]